MKTRPKKLLNKKANQGIRDTEVLDFNAALNRKINSIMKDTLHKIYPEQVNVSDIGWM